MIVSWMLYSLLVSALVAAAAWVLEEVCRLLGRPVRWVWIGAMGATLALVALAPLRTSAATSLAFDASVVRRSAPLAAEDGGTGVLAALTDAATAVRDLAGDTLREAATLGARIPAEALAGAWLALTAALLAVATGTLLRAGRERRRWPLHEVAGTPVRVAPRVGPGSARAAPAGSGRTPLAPGSHPGRAAAGRAARARAHPRPRPAAAGGGVPGRGAGPLEPGRLVDASPAADGGGAGLRRPRAAPRSAAPPRTERC
jgi:hypothetical protein